MEHAQHFIQTIKKYNKISKDWDGELYCGVSLKWNYNEKYVNISMPGYVQKMLQWFKHNPPSRPQHSPYLATPKQYGKDAQTPLPEDNPPLLPKDEINRIQQIVGSILYYGRAVDITILAASNHIGTEQAKATKNTAKTANHLLDYLATHPDAAI
ncbi:hypothetical protein ACHAXS_000312 [Conticribra weissflogii]